MSDTLEIRNNSDKLVSVFIPVKNAAVSIQRCINSVINQNYPNLEIIVQDAQSTDGTLEILERFKSNISLVSEPDSGPAEGLVRALNRCQGEYVIACLSDEELLPGAVRWAVDAFKSHSDCAAIYGDIITTDINGHTINISNSKTWDYKKVFCSEYFPYFCASIFRRACIESVGIPFDSDAAEFGLWWRLGAHYRIKYIPKVVAKFSIHINQLSENIARYSVHLPGRIAEIEYLASNGSNNSISKKYREKAIAGCYLFNAERLLLRHKNSLDLVYEFYMQAQHYKPRLLRLVRLAVQLEVEGKVAKNNLRGLYRWQFDGLLRLYKIYNHMSDIIVYLRLSSIKSIAIFGAWPGAIPLLKKYRNWNITVCCFIDNSQVKQGTKYFDHPVYPVSYILTKAAENIEAIVIASEESRTKMITQLRNMGYKKKII